MKNKYELLMNLDDITKNVYEKCYNSENYETIFNGEGILFVKKTNNQETNLKHEKIVLEVIISMAKKYKQDGIIHIDLSHELEAIMEKIKDDENIRHVDNRISWPIRQAFTKAIVSKKKKEVYDDNNNI